MLKITRSLQTPTLKAIGACNNEIVRDVSSGKTNRIDKSSTKFKNIRKLSKTKKI